ncbi:MAG: hypothetical protein ABL908_03650, partial [Hyphomicrobium sp.]
MRATIVIEVQRDQKGPWFGLAHSTLTRIKCGPWRRAQPRRPFEHPGAALWRQRAAHTRARPDETHDLMT